jgi:ubiquinone/menaquinone biosynthesis C-methylase UbiE
VNKGAHAERFSGRVQAYAAYRPRFPRRRILTFLREHGALRENAVLADIGAGTGMLAELFLEAGHRVIAIEPNEMRRACRELTARYLDLEVVKGRAEATTLPNTSVDLITVGRAMHWFDWRQAHREFGRILRAEGWF